MGKSFLKLAPALGYRAAMFNLVFDTNKPSLHLWRSLGFKEIGLVPKAGLLSHGEYVGKDIHSNPPLLSKMYLLSRFRLLLKMPICSIMTLLAMILMTRYLLLLPSATQVFGSKGTGGGPIFVSYAAYRTDYVDPNICDAQLSSYLPLRLQRMA